VWAALDPETTWLRSIQVEDRTLARAHAVLHQSTPRVAPGCVPLVLSDGKPHYLAAIVAPGGHGVQPARRQATGPAPQPRWMPLAELLYAPVVKTRRRRRSVTEKHRKQRVHDPTLSPAWISRRSTTATQPYCHCAPSVTARSAIC
jgi:hypothetical protein